MLIAHVDDIITTLLVLQVLLLVLQFYAKMSTKYQVSDNCYIVCNVLYTYYLSEFKKKYSKLTSNKLTRN